MEWYEIILRLLLAMVIGGLIGYDRESKNRPAGFRTHIIVCIGAAVASMMEEIMLVDSLSRVMQTPELASVIKIDTGRYGAQVITGIGFLGAGTILREKGSIKGLTTAASVWTVACIGLAVGSGYYLLAIAATISVFIVLTFFKKFEVRFMEKVTYACLHFEYSSKREFINEIDAYFELKGIRVKNIEFFNDEIESKYCVYTIKVPKMYDITEILLELYELDNVIKIKMV